jgi:hypothetical protein
MDTDPPARYRDRLAAAEIRVWKLPTRLKQSWLRDENRQTRRHRQHRRERITFRHGRPSGVRPRRSPINFREAARAA